ncbi:hypothetical protein EO98_03250 [Methanosarcina sp. 2.H.T.1A.6]|uniref:NosD domain-containing protein n=1 Tax=unclassified Methanosarcina TaxID=2644672 RepID=UPI0006211ED5|nr:MULTISPECIES: NosD domain-containing protein [unclassified Methanosarcina]KKG12444.1 hypothetical protein EO97_03145 [Methanosarcina sp. 2.H.T.1A.15]KKG15772.1 hypothetical protein EO94_09630 [Methanosarcina sp. 2.H.T.1A.3]KKG20614.1 hypothetical protein EO98_03250 [Methanosarcina sp. 2.H.T.1A.6]KKG23174.1 hypothetical protein EO96_01775 [Methanosarcina sp. 2.H.T.1A.8]
MGASRIIIFVAIALIANAVYNPVSAKEITVGNNPKADFNSIQEAVNSSSSGDIIFVLPGIYNESVNVKIEGLSILSDSENPEDTVVQTYIVSVSNVTISGFSIHEFTVTSLTKVEGCTVKNNKFLELGATIDDCSNSLFINNTFSGRSIDFGAECYNCILSENSLFDSGIHVMGAGGSRNNITIANNKLLNSFFSLTGPQENKIISNTIDGSGIFLSESHENIINNNFISNASCGISASFISSGNKITNNTLTSNTKGICVSYYSSGNVIKNNTISTNDIGISLEDIALITDNRIEQNRECGIYLDLFTDDPSSSGGRSLIYNNSFNNTVNLLNNTKIEDFRYFGYSNPSMDDAVWNTTKTSGRNIVGGPYLGGNYWAKPDGTGFSEICTDSDGDWICDSSYNINGSEIDYLPLASISIPQKPPVVNFSTNSMQGLAPLAVQFTDLSRYAFSWSWDFDNDGISDSTEKDPVYEYITPGVYTVSLTVSNANGTASKTQEIIAQEAKTLPLTDFSSNVTSGPVPLSVLFTDISQNAAKRTWDFNNDGVTDSINKTAVYMYTLPGTYIINLTVINSKGTVSKLSAITASPVRRVDGQLTLTEYQITTNELGQEWPVIYNDMVVWQDNRNGNDDIYMYDISTSNEIQVTANSSDQSWPDIYGDRIVWMDKRHGNTTIYMYNLSTSKEIQITKNGSTSSPAIYEDRIVWLDYRNGKAEIYIYDLSTSEEAQITSSESDKSNPDIYGDRIVWEDYRNGNSDIYMYNLSTSTEIQITTNDSWQWEPVIYGDRIIWNDNRTGNIEVYIYNLSTSTETRIKTRAVSAIYGDRILWKDYRNGTPDLYMCNLSTSKEIQMTASESDKLNPAIYGDRTVWTDFRNGNSDIYMCVISEEEEGIKTC